MSQNQSSDSNALGYRQRFKAAWDWRILESAFTTAHWTRARLRGERYGHGSTAIDPVVVLASGGISSLPMTLIVTAGDPMWRNTSMSP